MTATMASRLREARELYASAPDHAPYGKFPVDGYCVVTACDMRAYGDSSLVRAVERAAGFEPDYTNERIIRWNAEHTTDEVLAAFDRAIAEAEAG